MNKIHCLKFFTLQNIEVAEYILSQVPEPSATHFFDGYFFVLWDQEKNAWLRCDANGLIPCAEPKGDNVIELADLRRAVQCLTLLKGFGGVKETESAIHMAKVMRTMMVGRFCIHYVEAMLNEYKQTAH